MRLDTLLLLVSLEGTDDVPLLPGKRPVLLNCPLILMGLELVPLLPGKGPSLEFLVSLDVE